MWLFKLYLFWLNTLIHKRERILQQSRSCKISECFFLAGSTMSVDVRVILISTAWKVSVFGLFLVLIFRHSNSYSVRMRENTEQKNSEYGHFSPSEEWVCIIWIFHQTILKNYFEPWKGFKKVNKMGRDDKKGLGCKNGGKGKFWNG